MMISASATPEAYMRLVKLLHPVRLRDQSYLTAALFDMIRRHSLYYDHAKYKPTQEAIDAFIIGKTLRVPEMVVDHFTAYLARRKLQLLTWSEGDPEPISGEPEAKIPLGQWFFLELDAQGEDTLALDIDVMRKLVQHDFPLNRGEFLHADKPLSFTRLPVGCDDQRWIALGVVLHGGTYTVLVSDTPRGTTGQRRFAWRETSEKDYDIDYAKTFGTFDDMRTYWRNQQAMDIEGPFI